MEKLASAITLLSSVHDWDRAKLEWRLISTEQVREPEACLCGHYPIGQVCTIENMVNRNTARVGSCCVRKFVDRSARVFDALKRIRADSTRTLNPEALQHAYEQGWIDAWQYGFYFDTLRKRNLSPKQARKRVEINETVLMCATP